MIVSASHSGVEEIAHGCVVGDALQRHLGSHAATGGLDFDAGESEPAFQDIRLQLDVLDARVVEHDLVAHKYAPGHVDTFRIEAVAHGVKAEIEQYQRQRRSNGGG